MSRLIFKGNTVSNFGAYLPAPFIERITVQDDTIEVDLSLYVLVNEEGTDGDTLSERLISDTDLHYYVYLQPYFANLGDLYFPDDDLIEGNMWEGISYTNPIDEIKNKEGNIVK